MFSAAQDAPGHAGARFRGTAANHLIAAASVIAAERRLPPNSSGIIAEDAKPGTNRPKGVIGKSLREAQPPGVRGFSRQPNTASAKAPADRFRGRVGLRMFPRAPASVEKDEERP